jgi:hypothetical protein
MVCAVRGSTDLTMEPHIWFSDGVSSRYLPDYRRIDNQDFVTRFEAWGLSRLKGTLVHVFWLEDISLTLKVLLKTTKHVYSN